MLSEARLKGFFNAIPTIKTPQQLKALPDIILNINQQVLQKQESVESFILHIEGLLENSSEERFNELCKQAKVTEPIATISFIQLLDNVCIEVDEVLKDYNLTLLE